LIILGLAGKKRDALKLELTNAMKELDKIGKKTIIVIDGLNWVQIPSKISRVSIRATEEVILNI